MRSALRIGAFAVGFLLVHACADPGTPGQIGQPAPAFKARQLDGDSIGIADLKGQVVLLNIWATWCIPCRKEMPELQGLHSEYGPRGLRVVGVSIDEQSADETVRNFAKDLGISYTILRDPGEDVSFAFEIPGVPASFLIDRKGRVTWKRLGPFERSDPLLTAALTKALQASAP